MAETVAYGRAVQNYIDENGNGQQRVTDPGETRTVKSGTSGADEYFLNSADYAKVQKFKQDYANATTQAERDAAHAGAEAVRRASGTNYSGGVDGGEFIRLYENSGGNELDSMYDPRDPSYSRTGYGANTGAMRSALEQWKLDATRQAEGKIDYGVNTSTKELERALMEAQPQFQAQAEGVARDERQAMDNSALYAELRGDKGGIGQAQYNEIQAAAAQNKLAVQQAQTKLSTDTARQIEDLRAQGEFAKADAALQISQQYLQQLISLEQWAAEYNLSVAQFEASLEQWEKNYQLSMAQLQNNRDQFNASMAWDQSQFQSKQLSSMGQAMLQAGIMPSTEQLSAMGLSGDQASQYLQAYQLEQAAKQRTGTRKGNTVTETSLVGSDLDGRKVDTGMSLQNYAALRQALGRAATEGPTALSTIAALIENRMDQMNQAQKDEVNAWLKAQGY